MDVVVSYLPSAASLPPQGKGELAMVWRKAGPFPEPIPQIVDELTAEPTFLVTIRLGDGTWLNLLAAYVENIDFWPFRSMRPHHCPNVSVAGAPRRNAKQLPVRCKSYEL